MDDVELGDNRDLVDSRSAKESERRLEDITRLVSDWVWETDRDLVFTYVSERIFERLGFHPQEVVGLPLLKFANFEIGPDFNADEIFKRPFRDRHCGIKTQAGEIRNFMLSSVPIFNMETGAFEGVRGTAEDITDRQIAEDALSASERRYRSLVELSPVAILVHDGFEIIFANSAALQLFGAAQLDDLVGRSSLEMAHAEMHGLLNELHDQLALDRGPGKPVEIRHRKLDGTEFIAMDSVAQVAWQDKTAVMVVIQDITEIKTAQQAVAESEKRFREFAQAAADRFWETDAEYRFTYMSAFGSREGVLPAEDRIGKRRWEVAGAMDDEEFWAAHKSDIAARRPFRDLRFTLTQEDGQVHYMRSNGDPVYDDRGGFRGYRGTTVEETSEVLAKDQAENTRRLFFDAIENFSEGFALWDANDHFIYCNSYFRKAYELVAGQLAEGKLYPEFIRQYADQQAFELDEEKEAWLGLCLDDGQETEATIETYQNGLWSQIRKHRLGNGSTIIIYADVTEEKHRQQAIQESEYRLRLITDQIPAFIAYNDRDTKFTFANWYFETIGFHPEEIIGKTLTEVFGGDVSDKIQDYLDRAFDGEAVNYDNVIPKKNGGYINTNVSITPDIDENGEIAGVFVLSMDITDRKTAERELAASNLSLDTAQRIAKLGS